VTVCFCAGAQRLARLVICAALLPVMLAAPAPGFTQGSFPDKPVKFLINFPAGGPLDLLGRVLAQGAQAELNQPIVFDYRPGAGGNIGADIVAKSAADGYTVLLSIDTPFTVNPHLYASMPFEPRDLKPLMIFSSSGLALGVHASSAATTLAEFIAQARRQETAFSSAGNGSPGHLASQILAEATGAMVLHVPYRGNAPAVTALLGGEVQAGILATPGLLPQIQAGKVRALAVTGSMRSPLLPQVPTVAELGLRKLEFEVLYLAMVPAATPEPVVEKLRHALQSALASPEAKARLTSLDMMGLGETGTMAAARLAVNKARYGTIVKTTDMKAE